MAVPNTTPRPTIVGAVLLGNGTTYPHRFTRSIATATWLKSLYFTRSGGSVNGTVVPVYADGTVAGGNATAKTFLQTLPYKRLLGPRVTIRTAKLLVA